MPKNAPTPDLPTVGAQRPLPLTAADDSGKAKGAKAAATPTAVDQVPPTTEAPAVEPGPPAPDECTLRLPMLRLGFGYIRRRLDADLSRTQAGQLKALELGLQSREARLANGKLVASGSDAIRWLLEELAKSAND